MVADTGAPTVTVAAARYTATAQALHWVAALLMLAVVPLAWVMVALPHGAPSGPLLFLLHKSFGITILALTAVRLVWRATHRAPPPPPRLARWERSGAVLSHGLLYGVLVGMPVTGYVMSAAGGHPVSWFGLVPLPPLPRDAVLASAAFTAHVAIGQYVVYALVALHVLAVAWHVAARRDGVLGRMLPPERAGG